MTQTPQHFPDSEGPGLRQVLVYSGEDGCFVAECPSLPGCISQGATREEAIRNIREVIQLYIKVLAEKGHPIPADKLDAVLITV